jgi:outer membrane protein OmpA-like peptidoglycan-associated protein
MDTLSKTSRSAALRALVLAAVAAMATVLGCGSTQHVVHYRPLAVTALRPKKPKKPKKPAPRVHTRITTHIEFKKGSAKLRQSTVPALDRVADSLKRNPDITLVEIQGHTDNHGTRRRNFRLSFHRAESVRRYLIRRGVEPHRLACRGYGEEAPVSDNDTPEGRRTNRRVVFVVHRQKSESVSKEKPESTMRYGG